MDPVIKIDPFDCVTIEMPLPATRYDVPSTRCVRDPLNPALCLVAPVNVVPLTVATIESLIESVTSPDEPPPVRPVPALTAVMSPTCPLIVMEPLEPVVIETPVPAIR